MRKIALLSAIFLTIGIFLMADVVQAQITNPAIGHLGGNWEDSDYRPNDSAVIAAESGGLFLVQFVIYWRNAISIGAIILIVMFIWGGIEWIGAGGDSGKIQKARDRMLQATLGMLILASSFIIIGLISSLLFKDSIDLLQLKFFTSPNITIPEAQ